MDNHVCRKCGGVKLYIEENGSQCGLYCKSCGAWQKWLGKNEKRVVEQEIAISIDSVKDNTEADITILQATCAAQQEKIMRLKTTLNAVMIEICASCIRTTHALLSCDYCKWHKLKEQERL